MKLVRKILIVLVAVSLLSMGKEKMVKVKLADGITAMIPDTFTKMTPDDITHRFPSVRRPLAAYTSPDRLVSFGLNISATQWLQEDVVMAKSFFKASVMNLYDNVEFLTDEIMALNDKKFIVFEIESVVNGDRYQLGLHDSVKKYSYIMYYIEDGRTLVFNFSAPLRDKDTWKPIAEKIMASVKIKS